MAVYPLSFPDVIPSSSTFRLVRSSSSSRSPFTFSEKVYLFGGERWEGNISFPPLTRDQVAELQAFFLELQGQFGTFLYGDANYLANGPRGIASGSPLVAGAGQTGNQLNVDGLTASLTGWLKKGDYVQIGVGTAARLYQCAGDVNTNGSGQATIPLYPALRTSPADNQAVIVNGAKGLFRASSGTSETISGVGDNHQVSFGFVEAINE